MDDIYLIVVGVLVTAIWGLQAHSLKRIQQRVDERDEKFRARDDKFQAYIVEMREEFQSSLHDIRLRQSEQSGKLALMEASIINYKSDLDRWTKQFETFAGATQRLELAVNTLISKEGLGGK